ncbi:conserved hypothetical protein [Coccidioides posadasii str. Silveira]|uniref:Uncharacterized protein n=1 Tax=Coccidioides posadasii (strain RMSCC 757 / Silveira) TaxID=443226 RepID=E9CZC3_COCPS|nr:conserved hypothetical protein [Coccidioides posadasii str. Silveira]
MANLLAKLSAARLSLPDLAATISGHPTTGSVLVWPSHLVTFTRGRVATNPRWFCSSLNAHDEQRKQKTGTASQDRACMSPPKSWRQPDDKSLLFWKNAPDKAFPCNDAHVQNKLHVTPGTPSPGTPFSPPESTCSAPDASLGIDTSKYASRGGSPIQPHGVQTLAQIHTLTHIHIKEENATSESAGFRGVAQSARVREKGSAPSPAPHSALLFSSVWSSSSVFAILSPPSENQNPAAGKKLIIAANYSTAGYNFFEFARFETMSGSELAWTTSQLRTLGSSFRLKFPT